MPTLALSDVTLYYETDGAGPPVLLIAGFGSDGASWAPLLPHLGTDLHLIRPDNRTTGRTTPWNAPAGISPTVDDAIALLDHLEIPRAHIVGHSMGGLAAMDLVARYPDRAASTTLMGIAPMKIPRNVALFQAILTIRQSDAPPDTWLRAFFPWLFRPETFAQPELIEAAVSMALAYPHAQGPEAMALQLQSLADYDPSGRPIPGPTQALLGGEDLLVQAPRARAAFAPYPEIEIHMLPNAAHSLHWDDPAETARLIRSFITRHAL